jgi:hypothetical protein
MSAGRILTCGRGGILPFLVKILRLSHVCIYFLPFSGNPADERENEMGWVTAQFALAPLERCKC